VNAIHRYLLRFSGLSAVALVKNLAVEDSISSNRLVHATESRAPSNPDSMIAMEESSMA